MDENGSSFDNTDFDAEWESFTSEGSPNSDFGQNGGMDDFEQFSNQSGGGTYFDIDQTSESGSFIDTSQSNNDIEDYWSQQAQYTQPQMQEQYGQPQMQGQYDQPQMQGQYGQPQMQGQYGQPQMQGQYGQPQMQNQGQYVQNQQMQGQQQVQGQYTQNQQQGYPNQQGSVMDRINQNLPRQANFGYKATGFIIAGILIVLIIIVVLFTKIHPKSSSTVQPNQSTEQSTQTQQAPATSGYSLIEIPSSTNMTYGDKLDGSATVKGFERYLVGNQVLYSLELDVNGLPAKYFCTYSVYGSVNKGDILSVTYQMIDENYISIIDIRS